MDDLTELINGFFETRNRLNELPDSERTAAHKLAGEALIKALEETLREKARQLIRCKQMRDHAHTDMLFSDLYMSLLAMLKSPFDDRRNEPGNPGAIPPVDASLGPRFENREQFLKHCGWKMSCLLIDIARDKSKWRRLTADGDNQVQQIAAAADDNEWLEHVELVNRGLAVLNETERQIVSLHGLGGLTFKQIAELTSIPHATANRIHHRALQKIRDSLEEK